MYSLKAKTRQWSKGHQNLNRQRIADGMEDFEMKVLNFGSLNLDYVYAVDHFVKPGETISSLSRAVKHGGKGLNQSVALARAGADVSHAGCVGKGGESLRDALAENGVDVSDLLPVDEMQGHTVIQVTPDGEKQYYPLRRLQSVHYGGTNKTNDSEICSRRLAGFAERDQPSPGDCECGRREGDENCPESVAFQ